MAIKNKKSLKTSRKTSRKPRRKASRKTSRKPRRKASRKTSKKPRRKASRKTSKKPRRKASRKTSRKPRRKTSRKTSKKPRRKASRKTNRKKFRVGHKNQRPRRNDGRKHTSGKPRRFITSRIQELRYGKCRIPRWGKQLGTQMISPLDDSMQRVETCAQYIIHAHGCHTKITKKQVLREDLKNIKVITYAPVGESLHETCARKWHDYLVRRRPQFINPVFSSKTPPQPSRELPECRPWIEFSADIPRSEIIVEGDDYGQFKSGVLDITDCCNRHSQRASYNEYGPKGIQAPIVMRIKPGKVYRLSEILKQIKAYNDTYYPGLKNIFVHLLTCMVDASKCSGGNCRREETDEEYEERMEREQAALHHGW